MSHLVLSFVVSLIVTLFVVRSGHRHERLSSDYDLRGPQKFHTRPVPRVGGLGVFVALLAGISLAHAMGHPYGASLWLLLLAAFPAFGSGLAEDLTKRVSAAPAPDVHDRLGLPGGVAPRRGGPSHRHSRRRPVDRVPAAGRRADALRRDRRRQLGQHHRWLQRPRLDVRADDGAGDRLRGVPGGGPVRLHGGADHGRRGARLLRLELSRPA